MRIDSPTATAMPGSTPSTATARVAAIDSQNSTRRCDHNFFAAAISASENAARMTMAPSTEIGSAESKLGASSSRSRIASAPMSPVTWLRAPALNATAVRDPLVLTAKPWKNPASTFAAPIPTISWLPSIGCPVRRAYAVAVEIVSARATSVMPRAPATSKPMSPIDTSGTLSGGKPWGKLPTTLTPLLGRSR